jgi:pimeloyl-ACP methyl ester carboxylesterase
VIALFVIAGIAVAGLLYQSAGEFIDARRYPPPGQLVGPLHLNIQGAGKPTVVLESGIAGSSLGWSFVESQLIRSVKVCTYDRSGLGWSAALTAPRTVERMVSELAHALSEAGVAGPYILVGHSFGGLLIRAFAHFHPNLVAGLVFVDPVTIRGWANAPAPQVRRLEMGVKLSRRGAWLARFGIVRAVLFTLINGGRWLPQIVARASAGRAASVIERLITEVQKLPPQAHPIIRAHWSRPKAFQAMAAYLECLPASARTAIEMSIPPGIPFVMLSAATATEDELAEREGWVALSLSGTHVQLPNTGHWLQLERPEAIAEAVLRLCEQIS